MHASNFLSRLSPVKKPKSRRRPGGGFVLGRLLFDLSGTTPVLTPRLYRLGWDRPFPVDLAGVEPALVNPLVHMFHTDLRSSGGTCDRVWFPCDGCCHGSDCEGGGVGRP